MLLNLNSVKKVIVIVVPIQNSTCVKFSIVLFIIKNLLQTYFLHLLMIHENTEYATLERNELADHLVRIIKQI